jgi:glycosyltransferase involved in cell wall biosynthesis
MINLYPVLSIMIVTRNRKEELLRALQSCIECSLPNPTEFVIVDNASQDGTKEAVDHFFQMKSFDFTYRYIPENVGPAGGRNEGLRWARGRYVYFMDDDVSIDCPKSRFFDKMTEFLKENEEISCVTTKIYDSVLNETRSTIKSKDNNLKKYDKVLRFHGGSFFVDKNRLFNQNELFLDDHFWGMEELYPSLKYYFNNRYVAELKDIQVIHESSSRTRLDRATEIILHYTGAVHVKLIFYPRVIYPFVYLLFCLRIIRHLGFKVMPRAFIELAHRNKNLKKETIPISMFVRLVREFGIIAII